MLISMAVYDTEENGRTAQTRMTLRSLASTVDWQKHRLIVSDNGSCDATRELYKEAQDWIPYFLVISNGENLGTARAINRAWSYKKEGEHLLKMDNDVVINHINWADEMELVFDRDRTIGICGLKRKDLEERPDHDIETYKSQLKMLQHKAGERWIVVEEVKHVMGTCQAYSSGCFDEIGYMYQGDWHYGFDDALASLRARIAGLSVVFLPWVDIDHVDPGNNQYTLDKTRAAGEVMERYSKIVNEYRCGLRSVYFDGGEDAVYSLHN